jgi:hypothetical protein
MTVTVSVPPTTEARLRSHAAAPGQDVSTLVVEAIEQKFGGIAGGRAQSAAEFDQTLDKFFAVNAETLSPLPADFSRADIYSDHD